MVISKWRLKGDTERLSGEGDLAAELLLHSPERMELAR